MAPDESNQGISGNEKCVYVQTYACTGVARHKPDCQSIGNDAYGGTKSKWPVRRSAEKFCQDMPSPQYQHAKRVQEYMFTVYLENYLYSFAGDHGILI